MSSGIQGTYVIAWSQVKIDGMSDLFSEDLTRGVAWSWEGDPVRIDGPAELLRLGEATDEPEMRRKAARAVKKLIGAVTENIPVHDVQSDVHLGDSDVLLTDGQSTYVMTIIDVPNTQPLVMFVNELPPQDTDFWVVDRGQQRAAPVAPSIQKTGGILCVVDNIFLRTPSGVVSISSLQPGDMLETRDNGPQPVLWAGPRRMTGARLQITPSLRPIRIKANAFAENTPRADMMVAPNHRMIVTGQVAMDLYNTDEVLVAVKDLINGQSIYPETRCREITYYHILMESQEMVWVNGMLTESFHPAQAHLTAIGDEQAQVLSGMFPHLAWRQNGANDDTRRVLTASEAASLRFG